MKDVYFLSYSVIDNYVANPEFYKTELKVCTERAENLEPAYHYWILKNSGIDNIHLVDNLDGVPAGSYVVVTHSVRDRLTEDKHKYIQIVTDDPEIDNCYAYLTYDQSVIKKNRFYDVCKYWSIYPLKRKSNWDWIRLPLPVGITKCKPQWPPKTFVFLGSPFSLWADLKSENYIQSINERLDVKLKVVDDRWHNDGDEHVMFGFRPNNLFWSGFKLDNGNYSVHRLGHKTPNRLYQAWYMNIPSMFENNPAMMSVRKTDNDYLIHTSIEQFENNIIKLKTDEGLYNKMVSVAKQRQDENSYEAVVHQWIQIFNKFIL